ncbi:NADH-quinone oxidoreductase subunit M [bacterium]|nr:NADH-quinone oxidoreductase subunit M [bacterium]
MTVSPLSAAIWIPALMALVIALLPSRWVRSIQALAILGGGASLFISIQLFATYFQQNMSKFQEVHSVPWLTDLGIQYKVGIDGLSLSMILLTGLVSWAALWMSISIDKRQKEFFVLTLLAITGVYGVFASIDLFFFVIFYELASIPMYFLVGIWGSDKPGSGRPIYKEQAATKLLIYLQLGGGLVLLGILALYFATGAHTFDFQELQKVTLSETHQKVLFVLFFVGFGIEAGLVPLHTWLPEGHSSAPTPLSMLLAGVLLKMGGYGILRFGLQLTPLGAAAFFPALAALGGINVLYGGLCALRQSDVKVMIAYSSVGHMGMFFLGIGCFTASQPYAMYGLLGAQFQLFSHGVITAMLFAVAGAVYGQTHTRDLRGWGGLAAKMPVFTFFYVLAAMGSLGLPGLTGFWAEFMVLFGTWGCITPLAVAAVPGLLLTTMFLLRSVQYGFFGPLSPDHLHVRDAAWWEAVPLITLAMAALFFGCMPILLTTPAVSVLSTLLPRALP